MTEREMEDLLWDHPEKLLNEPLQKFERQPVSAIGRPDLIFVDRIGRLIVVELKRDTLQRAAIPQIVDYFGLVKSRFPDRVVELIVIANQIPPERRTSCAQYNIDAIEIPQKKFRDVAQEVGYVFESETAEPQVLRTAAAGVAQAGSHSPIHAAPRIFAGPPSKVEKAWYYWTSNQGRYFLAFVNAKGSCSVRLFDADTGAARGKEYRSGDYQDSFSDYVRSAIPIHVSRQPNLERDCRSSLPSFVFSELRRQVERR